MTDSALGVDSLFSVRGKVALVTGGSRGIGLMIASGYVEAGATVYISSRSADVCDAVAGELSSLGNCVSLPTDLSTMEGVESLCRRLAEREEHLHVLINKCFCFMVSILTRKQDKSKNNSYVFQSFVSH